MVSLIAGFAAGYLSSGKVNPVHQPLIQRDIYNQAQLDQENNLLKSELQAANNEISDLAELNHSLTQFVEQYNIPIPASTTYTGLLERIDKLPVKFINQQLSYLFDEEYISNIDNPHEFSKTLVEIALSQQQEENVLGAANIVFSCSPIKGLRELAADITIDQFDTLYAHITPTQDIANAIVKWQHVDSGVILLFTSLALDTQKQSQYVVIRPGNGWHEGRYQVTIHDMGGNKQLIATNSFHVSAVNSSKDKPDASGPDNDILQDLIISGRAIPKIDH